ncbi:MAG: helix-turn-helix transcriptional regulator [Bdellovibrionaceae bacterium]|nr:helix-turn-helix transcriptional regulator [Pseudobdellovibrionaceae bacterium]
MVGRLRQQRLENGWSQRELAEETGLTQQAITRLLHLKLESLPYCTL